MPSKLKTLAIIAALAAGTSSAALAQSYGGYTCPAGYVYAGGACQPAPAYVPSNPVSGAAQGAAVGAATGAAAAGPVGAVVGGALGTATGAVTGAADQATGIATGYPPPPAYGTSYPPPAQPCAPGYMVYNGGCYPAR